MSNQKIYKESVSNAVTLPVNDYIINKSNQNVRMIYNNLIEILGGLEFDSVLDVDCGKGTLLATVEDNYKGVSISGIDSSHDRIKAAKRKLGSKSDLIACDSEILPWEENSFDVVLCVDSFQSYSHPEKVLAEIKRVIKPEGYLIITDYWKPAPIRQIINLILYLFRSKMKIYSKVMLSSFIEDYGFNISDWKIVSGDEYILVAQIEK